MKTSENVVFKTQCFHIMAKSCSVLDVIDFFQFNYSINFKSCDVMLSISVFDWVHSWEYICYYQTETCFYILSAGYWSETFLMT